MGRRDSLNSPSHFRRSRSDRSESESEGPPAGGDVLGEVVVEHDGEQRENHHEAHLDNAFLDPQEKAPPRRALKPEQEQMAAVEDRYGQEVEDAELQRDR